ncbi:hypothetical protein [Fusobacterium phage FNU_1P]|nr:hypothetical protein [Fusobacterium phage FNU_1P]
MKKWFLLLLASLSILLVGCTSTEYVAKSTLTKNSDVLNVSINKVTSNKFYILFENKSDDIVELILSESTINNKPIYDENELDEVANHNALASIGSLANNLNSLGGQQYIKKDDSKRELTKKSNNIVLSPKEKVEKKVGYSTSEAEFPAKVVIKFEQNNKKDYIYINVDKMEEIKK